MSLGLLLIRHQGIVSDTVLWTCPSGPRFDSGNDPIGGIK